MRSLGSSRHCIQGRRCFDTGVVLLFFAIRSRSAPSLGAFFRLSTPILLQASQKTIKVLKAVSEAVSLCTAMAALCSCDVLNSLSDAATISLSSVPKTARMRSPPSLVVIRGASESQRTTGAKQRADAKWKLSRRGVMFTSLSTVGILLLPKSSPAVEVDNIDFREKLLEQIDNLQQLVSKSLGDATEAVTTKAEEAMSSLKFGNDKAVENLTEIESSTVETVQEDKLAQN